MGVRHRRKIERERLERRAKDDKVYRQFLISEVTSSAPCPARRENDEMACHRCGTRWDVADPEPPVCKSTRRTYRA